MLHKVRTEPSGYAAPKRYEIPLNELYLAAEAPKGVDLVVRDSGSGSPLTDEELKASIYHNGVLVPLIYKVHADKKYVIAGNRRLRMLRHIFSDAMTTTVPCHNVADFGADYGGTNWRQIALDTNLSLPPHIVERYEQIVLLAKDLKLTPEDARLRFGLTPRQFNQVMALGKMSPVVRKAWKDGTLTAKAAQLFTMEPDPKEQEKTFEKAIKRSHHKRLDEWDVRNLLVPQSTRELGKLVAFVGVDVAKAANVVKQEDLFENNHIVSDPKALNKLVGDKLAGIKKKLLGEGWSWALLESELSGSEWSYGTMTPGANSKPTEDETAELEQLRKAEEDDDDAVDQRLALEEKIKQRGFTEAQRKKGGCILKILNDGSVSISYGRTKPEERKAVERAQRTTTAAKKKAKAGVTGLSNALIQRLSEQMEKGLRDVIKSSHDAGVAALIAGVASSGDVINVKAGDTDPTPSWQRKKTGSSFASVFSGAYTAQPEARNAMLAQIAGEALSLVVFNANAKFPSEDPDVVELVKVLNADKVNKAIAAAFEVKGYFESVPMPLIVEAVRCACGEGPANEVAKMKKSAAVAYAVKHIPATGWLPKQLRTAHYKGPVEAAATKAAKKDKKPRPVKKAAPAKKKRKA